jgi:hypothetical protein
MIRDASTRRAIVNWRKGRPLKASVRRSSLRRRPDPVSLGVVDLESVFSVDNFSPVVGLIPADGIEKIRPVGLEPIMIRLTVHDVVRKFGDAAGDQGIQCVRVIAMREMVSFQGAGDAGLVEPNLSFRIGSHRLEQIGSSSS